MEVRCDTWTLSVRRIRFSNYRTKIHFSIKVCFYYRNKSDHNSFCSVYDFEKKPKTENIAGVIIVMAGLYILTDAYFKTPGIGDVLTLFCAVFLLFMWSILINTRG